MVSNLAALKVKKGCIYVYPLLVDKEIRYCKKKKLEVEILIVSLRCP